MLSRLFSRVDVCIGGVEDAEKLFGVRVPRNVRRREGAAAEYAAQRLRELFGFAWVGMTLRGGASASVNDYSGLVCCAEGCFGSRPYQIQIVDRIGAGDAFTAGMVFQILSGAEPARVVEFAAAGANTIGDFNLVSADEVEELLRGRAARAAVTKLDMSKSVERIHNDGRPDSRGDTAKQTEHV